MALCAANSFAQYTEQAPAGGFDVSKGSDYIVFYAPASFVSKIEANSTMLSNQNLDPNSVTHLRLLGHQSRPECMQCQPGRSELMGRRRLLQHHSHRFLGWQRHCLLPQHHRQI